MDGADDERLGWLTQQPAAPAVRPLISTRCSVRVLAGLGVLAVLLASCSNLGSTTSRTACRIQLLLEEATSAVERGSAAHVEGDAVAAAKAGAEATSRGTELHDLLPFAVGLSTDVLADLESAAINAQQMGSYIAGPAGDAQSDENLSEALDAMKGTSARWTATVRSAGVTCE